jgi:HEAT repeat protein
MSHALLYAKSLSLLLEEVADGSDLLMVRSGLRRVRRFANALSLTVTWSGDRFAVNGVPVTNVASGLQRLQGAMAEHAIEQIVIGQGAAQNEVLQLAMLLKPRAADVPPVSIIDALRDAELWSVQLTPVRRMRRGPEGPTHAADVAIRGPVQLAARIRAYLSTVDEALREGNAVTVTQELAALAAVERDVMNRDAQSQWRAAFDKAATPEALTLIANALPTSGDVTTRMIAVLKRAGDAGATALLTRLRESDSMDVRRAAFDALSEIKSGVSQLRTMLSDARWDVVRNAACLLGLYAALDAEPELTAALSHDDARVRAAAVTALLQLDTPTARATVRSVVRDPSPEVRRRAVHAFIAEPASSATLDRLLMAMEFEQELDVQLEFLYALGSMASPDAVKRLMRIVSVEGHLHPAEYRIAAAEALASARKGASLPLLKAMLTDENADARAAAQHLIRAVS